MLIEGMDEQEILGALFTIGYELTSIMMKLAGEVDKAEEEEEITKQVAKIFENLQNIRAVDVINDLVDECMGKIEI